MLHVFRDVTLTQLNAAFLYEMSKLMTEDAIERVNLMSMLFAACVRFYIFLNYCNIYYITPHTRGHYTLEAVYAL